MTEHVDSWFVVGESHAPHLIAYRDKQLQNARVWVQINGPVMIITEHLYRRDENGVVLGLVDSRTRLVVRESSDDWTGGHPSNFEPRIVTKTSYRQFKFSVKEDDEK